jgi:hypothetical protein
MNIARKGELTKKTWLHWLVLELEVVVIIEVEVEGAGSILVFSFSISNVLLIYTTNNTFSYYLDMTQINYNYQNKSSSQEHTAYIRVIIYDIVYICRGEGGGKGVRERRQRNSTRKFTHDEFVAFILQLNGSGGSCSGVVLGVCICCGCDERAASFALRAAMARCSSACKLANRCSNLDRMDSDSASFVDLRS